MGSEGEEKGIKNEAESSGLTSRARCRPFPLLHEPQLPPLHSAVAIPCKHPPEATALALLRALRAWVSELLAAFLCLICLLSA